MNTYFLILLIAAAIISSSAFFAFSGITEITDQIGLAISFMIVITQTAATCFFLASLKAFKKELRIAYSILAAGIFLFGLFPVQLLIGSFVDIDPIVTAAAIVLPSLIGSMILYLGTHQFAHILKIRSPWASLGLAFLFATLMGIVTAMIPHVEVGLDELTFDLVFGSFIGGGTFSLMAAMLILAVKKELGASYNTAMKWLALSLFVASFACLHETIIRITPLVYAPFMEPYFNYSFNLVPYLVAALLFLKAGFAFRMTSVELAKLPENATYLDVINYVAGIASTPAAIDVALDKMHEITARQTNTDFSTEDKAKLMGIYLRIEEYLVTKEPLRNISRERLRRKLSDSFQRAIADHEKQRPPAGADIL